MESGKRRRGRQLEDAILDAAWEEFVGGGYAAFTIDAVAQRARKSRHVLYRRWPTRGDLALAAIRHNNIRNTRPAPDTGSLRNDVIELLKQANDDGPRVAAIMSMHAGTYYRESGTIPAELQEAVLGNQARHMDTIIQRAIERGEIDPSRASARIIKLPSELLRHEVLMTLAPVPTSTIVDIVDVVFMPLISGHPTSS